MATPHADAPAYHRVVAGLRGRIESGELRPGWALPAEDAISREYGVSRTTVRRAMEELRLAGLAVTRKGWGSYVRDTQVRHVIVLAAGRVGGRPATRRDARVHGVQLGAPMLTIRRDEVEIAVPADRVVVEVHVREP